MASVIAHDPSLILNSFTAHCLCSIYIVVHGTYRIATETIMSQLLTQIIPCAFHIPTIVPTAKFEEMIDDTSSESNTTSK